MPNSKLVAQQAADKLGKQPVPVIREGNGYRLAPGAMATLDAYSALKTIAESE